MAKKNFTAAIAYIFTWISGLIIYLFTKKSDKFTRFHAAQAIMLGIAIALLGWIPLIGWAAAVLLYLLGLYVAFRAYNGEKSEIPILGNFANKFV